MSDGPAQVDVLEGGLEPPWWRRAWTSLPPRGRRGLAALLALAVAVALVVLVRERTAEQARREQVSLGISIVISSSSTHPPGGQVRFLLVVRNLGPLPVSLTAVAATGDGLRLRMQDDAARPVGAGGEIEIPLSVRLTCPTGSDPLTAEIGVLRDDGGSTSRRVQLRSADRVLDVAATVCSVRPDLRDHELSGPVLRAAVGSSGDR